MALLDKLKIGGVIYDAWATKDQIGNPSDFGTNTVFGKLYDIIYKLTTIMTTAPYAKESTASAAKTAAESAQESAGNVEAFFGLPDALPQYTEMTEQEVYDILEDIMPIIDTDLTAEQAAAITAETEEIIHSEESSSES